MISINTLDKMIEHRHWLTVHCHARDCHNRAEVDLPALAKLLGGDHPCLAKDLRRYFVCSKCGSRDVGFTTGVTTPNIFAGAHVGHSSSPVSDRPAPKRHRHARRRAPKI